MNDLKKLRSLKTILMTLILLLAGFLRLYRLESLPPGMHFDVAFNYFDIFRLLRGDFALFFPANNGREPLYFYLSTVGVALFNDSVLAERLTSAIIGIATIPVLYWLARSLFYSTRLAFLASFFLAISVWHIYYSRYGLRVILAVLLTALAVGYFWRGIASSLADDGRRSLTPSEGEGRWGSRARIREFSLAGVFLALALYTYTSSRFVPIIFVAITLCAMLLYRARSRSHAAGLAIAVLVATVIFLPLGFFFLTNPDQFFAHGTNLSLLDLRVNKGDLFGTLAQNIFAVGGMFLVRGDHEMFRNIANRPVFGILTGALFLAGIGLLLFDLVSPRSTKTARLRALLIALSLIILISPSALSDDPPNFTRTLPAVTFAVILPAWAVARLWERIPSRNVANIALGAVLLGCTAISFRDYFFDFASSPALYGAFHTDKVDAAQWVAQESARAQVYLAPLWAQNGTLGLYTRRTTLKSFESRDTMILPGRAAGKDALVAFPLEQERKSAALGERLGTLATREMIRGSNGENILIAYRVHAKDLPDLQDPLAILPRAGAFAQPQTKMHATWAEALELLGYSVGAADAPKRNLEVTLFAHAIKPMVDDYTFSLKARDDRERVWGQEDKWLGDNSYATSIMSAGDLVIEKFYPGLNPCAPAGDYRVSAEMYDPKTGHVVALSDGKTLVDLGTTRAATSLGNLYENLEPEQLLDAEITPQLRVFGFTLTPDETKAGDDFSLSLFWRGAGDGTVTQRLSIRLQNTTLAERELKLPPDGRGLCTLFDLRAPANIAPGPRALFVNDFKIGTLNIK